jgi:hypothetical protein
MIELATTLKVMGLITITVWVLWLLQEDKRND